MSSKTEIANLALSHLAVGKEIANIETENSVEATACRRFYDVALEQTLSDFAWPFATRIATLGLIEEEPTTEWGYSYRYPSNCLHIRRVLSGFRNDDRQSRSPYKIASDSTGRLIYSDEEDAQIEYTVRATDTTLYPGDFVMAFSLYLALLIAPKVTGGDQFKLGERAGKLYGVMIAAAKTREGNEEQAEEVPEAEWIRARE